MRVERHRVPHRPIGRADRCAVMKSWEFWIDVGGTFTDCIARGPKGRLTTCKVLSSGVTKGRLKRVVVINQIVASNQIADAVRRADPENFWVGYGLKVVDDRGNCVHANRVTAFDRATGILTLRSSLPQTVTSGMRYELSADEEAPLLAMRRILGLRLGEPFPEVALRLGTTRGTNALLTRGGARTALVTTKGFADVLRIGNQNRPRLFDLVIRKPEPLFERVVEVDERISADGEVLHIPDESAVRESLAELKQSGIESLAICCLHSFANPSHEELIERIAREVGLTEISRSSRLSPLIKIVSRGDTTVVDAYLNPILREYVGTLRRPIGIGTVKMMTSAGGLVDADQFVGKDSILSGPAGGVIGFSRIAQRAGFDRAIGFDMGGTSTDVSRFDGTYELEFETQKAGVRVVAPMLAIETVAAGGGSLCDFDGVKLTVGPQSAGAIPGPACYGAGGPLTVTDINLYLGRIVPERFPFPLDQRAVDQRLRDLCERVVAATGRAFTPIELAEGFFDIANANMVRPIRNISVSRGYDPADYVLVTFGGAGAQHACAIARSLGIRRILVHPYAGILSAFGMGLADVRRFGEQAVLKPYSPETLEELETVFARLEQQTLAEVLAEQVPRDQIASPIRSLEIRYQGVEATISVTCPADGNYAAGYERQHERLYGYRHQNRALEITAARVEVVGRTADPPDEITEPVDRHPQPTKQIETRFSGRHLTTGLFFREQLHAGDRLIGPAILCEPTSTIVIDPGFHATVTERGDVLIEESAAGPSEDSIKESRGTARVEQRELSDKAPLPADPVLLEIFNNLFASIAEQMGITLRRTSLSTNVKERLDFSCALFSPTGDLVVNAPHIPVHLGAMSETVKRILADNPRMGPGDVFVTNDPYRGGSHLPDVTVVTPVYDERTGTLLFFTASRAHHAEIGGIVPGSMPPFSKNLGEEGVLIRNFKLVDRGRSRENELRGLLESGPYASRAVGDNMADISAQVAANNRGVAQLRQLIDRYSLPIVEAYMGHIQRAAATKMRRALAALEDGTYSRTDHLDDGSPMTATITIRGDSAVVDFTGTGPVLDSNLNANRAIVTAAVLYVFRCLIDEDIPLNGGVLEPVEIVLPEGLLNPPENQDDPARSPAVVGGNVETSQRVVDILLGALEVAAASQGTMNNLTFGDETFGYYETICGGSGATPDADGTDAVHTHMTNTRLTDVEVIERRYPVRVREFSIRRGSGGRGQHHGGDGIVRRIEFLKPLVVSILSERRGPYPPFGLAGADPGAVGRNSLQRAGSNSRVELGGKVAIDVGPGDVLTIETPGGGGYGTVTS